MARGPRLEGGIGQTEGDVGVGGHQGEQHPEAGGEGGQEARVGGVGGHPGQQRGSGAGWRSAALPGQPGLQGHGGPGRQHAQDHEGPVPAPAGGHQAAGHAPGEAAHHGAGHVDGHDPAGAPARPFLLHVGHRHREHPRREQALQEPPEHQGAQSGGGGVQEGRQGQQAGRPDHHALAPQAVRHRAHQGRGDGHPQGGGGEGEGDRGLGGLEQALQQRQQRLGGIEPQERREAGERHRQDAPPFPHRGFGGQGERCGQDPDEA